MEPILQLDIKLIAATESGLLSVRRKLGLSHPAALAWAGSITIFLLALSTFLGTGSLYYTKVPLLVLYAILAYWMGGTVIRMLGDLHDNWGAESERIITIVSLKNRRTLWPLRLMFALGSIVFLVSSISISLKLIDVGAITYARGALNVFSAVIGLPALLLYQYLQCARPNGGRLP
ncbi:hypothetical protein HFN89_06705 [Rhizobium laguerreae]|nr:hypothetical protein [Rhizobium laguerreae]